MQWMTRITNFRIYTKAQNLTTGITKVTKAAQISLTLRLANNPNPKANLYVKTWNSFTRRQIWYERPQNYVYIIPPERPQIS